MLDKMRIPDWKTGINTPFNIELMAIKRMLNTKVETNPR